MGLLFFGKEFILSTDHYSLKFLQTQKSISKMHARWISFLQKFDFVFKNRTGHMNKTADDALRKKIC